MLPFSFCTRLLYVAVMKNCASLPSLCGCSCEGFYDDSDYWLLPNSDDEHSYSVLRAVLDIVLVMVGIVTVRGVGRHQQQSDPPETICRRSMSSHRSGSLDLLKRPKFSSIGGSKGRLLDKNLWNEGGCA